MVKHMIIWKTKDDVADTPTALKEVKTALEGLVGQIDGLLEMHILTDCYPCSAGDVMMDSLFTDIEALNSYQAHPKHQEIASGMVSPLMAQRLSFDYEV
jgi:hypothetical protein